MHPFPFPGGQCNVFQCKKDISSCTSAAAQGRCEEAEPCAEVRGGIQAVCTFHANLCCGQARVALGRRRFYCAVVAIALHMLQVVAKSLDPEPVSRLLETWCLTAVEFNSSAPPPLHRLRDSGFDGTSQRGADLLAQLEVLQKLVAAQQSQMPTFEFSRSQLSALGSTFDCCLCGAICQHSAWDRYRKDNPCERCCPFGTCGDPWARDALEGKGGAEHTFREVVRGPKGLERLLLVRNAVG